MKLLKVLLPLILIAAATPCVQAQERSLEDLESMSEPLEPAEAKTDSAAIKPVDVMRPASDPAATETVDIRSHMKKISEPNLFAGAPVNMGTIRSLASGEAPEEYQVQEGDNLYDICDQLIDEPNYWPKLWAFNPEVTNPHFVYPGMRLRFYAGDADNVPFLQVITEDDILPVSKGKIVESELVKEDITGLLMRSELSYNSKLLSPDDIPRDPKIDSMFIDAGGTYSLEQKTVVIPAFIVDEDFEELGVVVGGSAGSILVDKGQQVIVTQKEGLKIGTTYSVVRRGHKITTDAGETVGTRYEFVAQLKLTVQDKNDEDVFKGEPIYDRFGMIPGDILIPYRAVKRKVPFKYETTGKGLEQTMVSFTYPDTEMGGRGDFVFIDQANGKLKEKETYSILQNVKVAALKAQHKVLPDTDSHVAHVYVLDTSGAAAIGYILHDSFEVRKGDRIAP